MRARGFTLIELMVGLAVMSILLLVAVPSFSNLLAEQRLRQVSQELRSTLALARSEAVKRNQSVIVLPRSGDWSQGWCLESDASDAACGAAPLSEFVLEGSTSLTAEDGVSSVTFNAWGRASNCPRFQLQTVSGSGRCRVCLYVENDGRITAESGTCSSACPGAETANAWSGACGS